MNLIIPSNHVENCTINITNFGSSFFFGREPPTLHTPTVLCPPEIFFHESVSSAADIWTLGCTLYDILGERPLFEIWADDPDDVIGEMVSTLGKLPTTSFQLQSLEALLIPSSNGMKLQDPTQILRRGDRLRLAASLASSVLQFHGSWLKAQWRTKNIEHYAQDKRIP